MAIRNKATVQQGEITTCIYPPADLKSVFSEYDTKSFPKKIVASDGLCISSPPVVPAGAVEQDWQELIAEALDEKQGGAVSPKRGDKDALQALVQTIIEHGQEMQPLLQLLRQKAEEDDRLEDVMTLLHDHLSLSINTTCSLAPREIDVIEMAAQGLNNAEIADELQLKTVTVTKALSRAYRKLKAKNRTEAVRKWMLVRGVGKGIFAFCFSVQDLTMHCGIEAYFYVMGGIKFCL